MGDGSVQSDVELLSVLIEALQEAGLREFQVSVGQVEFFKALLREAGIGNVAEESLRRLISDKNRFGAEELLSSYEIPEKLRNTFLEMATLTGGEEALQKARSLTDNAEALSLIHI